MAVDLERCLSVIAVALLLATPVSGITFGQPDGNGHPNDLVEVAAN